jgi:hypothetical protein
VFRAKRFLKRAALSPRSSSTRCRNLRRPDDRAR